MSETAVRPTSAARAPARRWWSGLFWKCLLSMLIACWVSTGLLSVLGLYLTRIEVRDNMAPPVLERAMRRELQQLGPLPELSTLSRGQCEAMLQALAVRVVGMDTRRWMSSYSFAGGTRDGRIAIRYRDRDGHLCQYPNRPSAPLAQALEEAQHEAATTHNAAPRHNEREGDWISVVALPLADAPGASLTMGQHSGGTIATFMRADSGDLEGLVIYLMVISAMSAVAVATLLTRRIGHAEHVADAWAAGELDARIHDPGRDEFGRLSQRFDRMADALSEVIQVRQALAVAEERNRMARDLHDTAKQRSFALGLQLSVLDHLNERDGGDGRDPRQRALIKAALGLTGQLQRDLADVIQRFSAPTVAEQGLRKALEDTFSHLLGGSEIEWRLLLDGVAERGLSGFPQHAGQLLLIATEAAANSLRHSGARRIEVVLNNSGNRYGWTIQDDGCGFTISEHEATGMGLANMRLRARTLPGGGFRIASSPSGTVVTVSFTLEPAQEVPA
ncbi:HAMP domain-containing protein [Lysobacter sp. CA199]|uniref:sensor histidine kinase n=1 Tax=Lysobacter sp. CA199 TaxID=3455608 RepID=UPI003F8D48D9